MKKRIARFALGLLAASVLVLASCGRDAIFFTIATEVPPQPPLIRGGPTQMVVFDWGTEDNKVPVMFVASGSLFWYSAGEHDRDEDGNILSGQNASWQREGLGIPSRPREERIIDIAATRSHLYILVMTGTGVETSIYRLASGGSGWSAPITVSGPGNIQSIFADPQGGRLFAGVHGAGGNSIWFLDNAGSGLLHLPTGDLREPSAGQTTDTGLLSGVVLRDGVHFISTRRESIFYVSESALAAGVVGSVGRTTIANGVFMGMIKLPDNSIIAVNREGGFLYQADADSISFTRIGDTMRTGRDATGALALWREREGGRELLVAGIQGSRHATTFVNGYVEFELLATENGISLGPRREAGTANNELLSVSDNAQYRTSLGRLPLNHLFQAPMEIDVDMTFFASTQTAGLWSFRTLDGVPQWNAEN
ncbi:MAG: hypothetical protein FWB79_05205 [Treponema sp.]|nr:hypothetical protein [Treponema sp.]